MIHCDIGKADLSTATAWGNTSPSPSDLQLYVTGVLFIADNPARAKQAAYSHHRRLAVCVRDRDRERQRGGRGTEGKYRMDLKQQTIVSR